MEAKIWTAAPSSAGRNQKEKEKEGGFHISRL
jgi:hypothetical protein